MGRSRWRVLPLALVKFRPALDSAIGFLGISYVTFRSLDVVFAIRDRLIVSPRRVPRLSVLLPDDLLGADRSLSPFLSRLESYAPPRANFWKGPGWGIHQVFTGFLYKFILAALIKTYWLDRVPGGGLLTTVSYMYAYSLYLYFDFAGYSDFAVGVSYLLGIHTPENFKRPFLARNIQDFWNRWNISLSTWLRDHVYMRFKANWPPPRAAGSPASTRRHTSATSSHSG